MTPSRRRLLGSLLGSVTASAATAVRTRPMDRGGLGAPVLTDDRVVRFVAGIRPYRKGGPRIERQVTNGKVVIHNYGHGGAGFTLSWGSASLVARHLRDVPRGTEIAVLGAGVMGLSTAVVLVERGLRPCVYAREFSPDTTSDVAGAEWSPDIVDRGGTPALRRRFDDLLAQSWRRFQLLVGTRWGVKARPIYEAEGVESGLDDLPRGLLPAPRRLAALPFAPARWGRVYQTLLIEAPVFMRTLMAELERGGVVLERRDFAKPDDLRTVRAEIIVNCLGLGAGALFGDDDLVPIRGQLVHLRPQPLSYLLDHPAGYVVPRTDALVLGGSFESWVSDARTDPATCARILDANRRFFGAI